ncbi:hypothetical protein JCM10207_004575 [Rhodosporidiobolus poonsookiae]
MLRATPVWRTAANAARDALAPSSSTSVPSSSAPRPRSETTSLVHHLVDTFGDNGPPIHRLPSESSSKPLYLKVHDPAVFTHPSVTSYVKKEPRNGNTAVRKGGRRLPTVVAGMLTYEKHALVGKQMVESYVTELLVEKYPRLDVDQVKIIRDTLLRSKDLAKVSRDYQLPALLHADPFAQENIAQQHWTQTSLLFSYVAGLHYQEGLPFARQWVRQLFRSRINESFVDLLAQLRPRRAGDATPRKESEPPYNLLFNWFRKYRVKPNWQMASKGVAPRVTYRAEVTFLGCRAVGGGSTIKQARNAAAEVVLAQMEENPQALAMPETHRWAERFRTWHRERDLHPKYDLQSEGGLWRAELAIDGEVFQARGVGKAVAKSNVGKAALMKLDREAWGRFMQEDAELAEPRLEEGEVSVGEKGQTA